MRRGEGAGIGAGIRESLARALRALLSLEPLSTMLTTLIQPDSALTTRLSVNVARLAHMLSIRV